MANTEPQELYELVEEDGQRRWSLILANVERFDLGQALTLDPDRYDVGTQVAIFRPEVNPDDLDDPPLVRMVRPFISGPR